MTVESAVGGARGRRLRVPVLELVLVAVCVYLALRAPGFRSPENILIVLRAVSMQGIIAFGMTMVIIAGEIDLGVGSMVAFSGCVCAWVTGALTARLGVTGALACGILAALLLGGGVGATTGFLRHRFGVPSFISSLAWLTVLKGASELITNGFPLQPFPEWFNMLGGGYVLSIVPVPVIVFAIVFALSTLALHKTVFGRAVYAVGGNTESARLSGIHVGHVRIGVLAILGALSALAGIMLASQIMSGNATAAAGWELDVISAVIIGGTSLLGGSGTTRGTLIGIIFLGVLVNGMTLMNYSEYWQHVVRGALILTAVLVNMAPARRRTT